MCETDNEAHKLVINSSEEIPISYILHIYIYL